jgi:hypothetical protein
MGAGTTSGLPSDVDPMGSSGWRAIWVQQYDNDRFPQCGNVGCRLSALIAMVVDKTSRPRNIFGSVAEARHDWSVAER